MARLVRLLGTTIGRKLVMAVTGAMLLAFLVVHMIGNWTLFQGAESLNAYASWLKDHPLLWVARAGLLAIFGLHVATALSLAAENRRARPVSYAQQHPQAATASSRYIIVTGLLVLGFVVFHLAHFTLGWVAPEGFDRVDGAGRHDVAAMVVDAFRNPAIVAVYVVAIGILGFHLDHGLKSALQTLGINHASYNGLLVGARRGVVALLVVGNLSLPVLVWTGVVQVGG